MKSKINLLNSNCKYWCKLELVDTNSNANFSFNFAITVKFNVVWHPDQKSNCKILPDLAPDYSIINQYSFCVQLFCSTILGIWGLKFMGEFCCMLFKLCRFGQRKPNNIIDSQISQGSDGSHETRQNIQEPNVGPLINYVCYYSVIFFPRHFSNSIPQDKSFQLL